MVTGGAGSTKFYFSPDEAYTTYFTYLHMPILSIPSEIINAGKKMFKDIDGWEFAFDTMQVWPYIDDYRPHPAETDWIEINHEGEVYEVEIILTGKATDMPESTIDLYYKGIPEK